MLSLTKWEGKKMKEHLQSSLFLHKIFQCYSLSSSFLPKYGWPTEIFTTVKESKLLTLFLLSTLTSLLFFFFGFQKLENFSLEEFNFMSVNSGYWLQCMPVKLANMSHTELLYKNKVFINLQYWSILQNNYCKLLFQIQWYNKRCTWVTDSQNIPLCETDGQNKC